MNRFFMKKISWFFIFFCLQQILYASSSTNPSQQKNSYGISANPASVNISPGLGLLHYRGIRLGGVWLADTNYLFSGGIPHPKKLTSNNLFTVNLNIDTEKTFGWCGGLFGIEYLQFNGQKTNAEAGSIQGYNSLPGPNPLSRSELYQVWYRQELFNKKLIVRVGKTVPTIDFNNVTRPVLVTDSTFAIPSVSSLIYTPLFVNASMLGVLPGYYNSAYGITINFTPIKEWYLSYGVYDGSLANGVQTGIRVTPHFSGSYFNIIETGWSWSSKYIKPGNIAIGTWHQSGHIQSPPTIYETNASGFYSFGAQRLWNRHPGVDNSGFSAFYQYGINNSLALPIRQYAGLGLTGFGLIPCRPDDSLGLGSALSWLNPKLFNRPTELMYQAYYQAKIAKFLYLEPVLTYIPTPGASRTLHSAWAGTLRAIILF